MTTLQLVCFDGGIEFQGPFLKKLAPRSLPKMSAFFSSGQNLKWLPGITEMSIKNATFATSSPIQLSVWCHLYPNSDILRIIVSNIAYK